MNSKFFKGAIALLAFGVLYSGCSKELPVPGDELPVGQDSKFYVNVSIAKSAEDTRANASDFEQGTADEQKIHDILFVFYNTSNKYVGSTTVKLGSNGKYSDKDGNEVGGPSEGQSMDGSVETLLNLTVPVSVTAGSLRPAYVMTFINPTDKSDETQQVSLEQVLGLTRELDQVVQKNDDNTYRFTMSNSVYYEEKADARPRTAASIPEDGLFLSAEKASEDTDATHKVIIYVERVAAKVTVAAGATIPQTGNEIKDAEGNAYTLDFEVLGWGLNNLERGSFLVKNFRTPSSGNCEGEDFKTYFPLTNLTWTSATTNMNDLKNPKWNYYKETAEEGTNWGISGNRSFWAFSPTYYTGGEYPSYSDEVTEKGEDKYSLIYRSFDDIYNTKATGSNKLVEYNGAALGNSLYTLEHTMVPEVVTNQQKRGVTCAVVLGQYTLKKGSGTTGTKETFYIRNGVNAAGNDVSIIYPDDQTLVKAILTANNKIYVKNAEGATPQYSPVPFTTTEDMSEVNTYFAINHPSKAVTDGKYTPNRFVALQLIKNQIAKADYYLRKADGTYEKITTANLDEANTALYGLLNGIERYASGYAFFAIPIEHLWGKNDSDPKIGDSGFTAKLGQYGVVRNHLYTINIKGIDGIGTGIGDTTAPIIPNVQTEKYYVKTEMRVQRWRVVPAQDVTLKP